jgi:hypothetical protein
LIRFAPSYPARPHPHGEIRDMKTKAAIAYAAGKPLEVVTVELDGPKA